MASGNDPRTYSIATETANGAVNSESLVAEIAAEAGVVTALDHIDTNGDALDLYGVTPWTAGAEIAALDALVLAHLGTSSTLAFQFWESNPAQTTTAETWQAALNQIAAPMSSGVYRLSWYFELRIAATGPLNSRAQARFTIDGNVKGSAALEGEQWDVRAGWDRYVADEAEAPTLAIEYQRDPAAGGNDTIEIRKLKIGIEFMG